MQVFNLYFKILRQNIGIMAMYLGIFIGIVVMVIVPQVVEQEKKGYVQSSCDFAVFDYDDSSLSKGLVSYLESVHHLEAIENDEKETIQDELYATNVQAVIRINEGYEEAFVNGTIEEQLEVFTVPDTIYSELFAQNLNSFLSVVNTYVEAGVGIDEALIKAEESMEVSVDVSFANADEISPEGELHYFFKYLAWIFIAMCVNAITMVLVVIDKKGVKERIQCSSYKFSRLNMEVSLGVMVTGIVIGAITNIVAFLVFNKEMLQPTAILYVLNSFCMIAIALSIAFLVAKLTDNPQVISMMSNVLSLGMAFLCGVFVPMDLLGDTVIKIAHFLPVYWYVRAIEVIDTFSADKAGTLATHMLIQLLFAAAILCVGLIVAKRKRQSN